MLAHVLVMCQGVGVGSWAVVGGWAAVCVLAMGGGGCDGRAVSRELVYL